MTTRDLFAELKTSYKEYFESKLAITLLTHPGLFPSVKKVSSAIIDLITKNNDIIVSEIKQNEKIKEDLYDEKYFGRLSDEGSKTPEDILDKILKTLKSEDANLSQTMQIHSVFIYRLYNKITIDFDKKAFLDKYFGNGLFSNRCRVEKQTLPSMTKQLGITRNAVFCKLVGTGSEAHLRARDRFELDSKSSSHRDFLTHHLPFVADLSGHTSSFLLGVKLYGNLNTDELQIYALACFAFLAAGGNHSFHEVMTVAKQTGVCYEINNYAKSIPDFILQHASFSELMMRFPEFLAKNKDEDKENVNLMRSTSY